MQHLTVKAPAGAARRFFRAFYQWSTILNSSHHKDPLTLTHARTALPTRSRQDAFSTSRQLYSGHRGELAEQRNADSSKSASAESETAAASAATEPPSAPLGVGGPTSAYGDGFDYNANSASLAEGMRHMMRQMAHPVVVVTASSFPADGNDTRIGVHPLAVAEQRNPVSPLFRAMTVSSFTTVTLSPEPIISFNVKVPSRTFTALTEQEAFHVFVLAGNTAGASIADAFTKGSAQAGFESLVAQGMRIQFKRKRPFAPSLRGPGILMELTCELLLDKCVNVGDHAVVLAKVVSMDPGTIEQDMAEGEAWTNEEQASKRARGLLYANRAYRRVGRSIEPVGHDSVTSLRVRDEDAAKIQKTRDTIFRILKADPYFGRMPGYMIPKMIRYAFAGVPVWSRTSGPREQALQDDVEDRPGLVRRSDRLSRFAFRNVALGDDDVGSERLDSHLDADMRAVQQQRRTARPEAEGDADTVTVEEAKQEAQPTGFDFTDFEKDLPPEARFNLVDDGLSVEAGQSAQVERNRLTSDDVDPQPDESENGTREKSRWGSFGREAGS